MITFSVSKKFDVSPQAVWNIVKDINSIPRYWKGTRELHVNKVAEGIYEGVVRFAFPSKGRIRLIVDDKNRKLTFNYLSGPIKGYNIVEVKENEIISSWRVKMSLLLALAESWNAKHFKQGTEHALDRIISEAKSGIP
ncbi:conserved hypothetical protein [Acidianus hospitalis W1]|uniref:SRPBCC family protein n=1 Tax=Acidianus hospitalis (strain W1) TaxID=933801 RepID=F4B503_ACIHW|nr:hypothetical protein [Acidianus hospitalis]AEE93168.1 conserved hypothetical protein [Acidianus hospitalis W1]